eukprot:TRINITY_DN11448_c0_g2_i1.p1 TRINITY_DN11448_c0_g2~~TRINITY_DN11448_c0_g2_i1.p1  ORF type:complete len:503 (-),score=104.46 TRINITY_DN11448_c0_g2_i1:100-1608(-)
MASTTQPLTYGATNGNVGSPTSSGSSKEDEQALAPFVAEFVGTFVLVFTVGCVSLAPAPAVWAPTAIALMLMVMVYSTGAISGGHLNPAVSLSLGVLGFLDWTTVLRYWVAQLAGGAAAAAAFCFLFAPRVIAVAPAMPYTWGYAVLAEFVYTTMLCFVVNNCTASPRNNPKEDPNQFFGLAIGFVIIAGGYAATDISGACFNPAVSLALAGSSGSSSMSWGLLWTIAELSGAIAAALLFWVIRSQEFAVQSLAGYTPSLSVRCVSEFFGTFLLVFTVGLSIIGRSPSIAWAAAAALMCMIYSLGDVSGGHFNPAVSLAVVLSGRQKCSAWEGLAYAASQILAGSAAGLLYEEFHAAGPNAHREFPLRPGLGYGVATAGVAELFFTFVLTYVVLSCATVVTPSSWKTDQNFYFALAIGSCVTAGGFAAGSISGGELNPAVSVGIEVSNVWMKHPPGFGTSHSSSLHTLLLFSLYELAGGLLAAIVFRLTHPGEYSKAPLLGK